MFSFAYIRVSSEQTLYPLFHQDLKLQLAISGWVSKTFVDICDCHIFSRSTDRFSASLNQSLVLYFDIKKMVWILNKKHWLLNYKTELHNKNIHEKSKVAMKYRYSKNILEKWRL